MYGYTKHYKRYWAASQCVCRSFFGIARQSTSCAFAGYAKKAAAQHFVQQP
ncbi:hypothetical protein FAEPRAM212_02746 [Faecalibacterium prausnitzii M21/2]|uniref:Uncharacterized protein n=1 Tax=Faecalibacterium prausnitzii M21/2 TaxID=411485 RepID=A8SFG6_9FIRM|nr:hypothetical protein FAEPRAM212_02746 [Faecalibacterium prausnitzii M21/2]